MIAVCGAGTLGAHLVEHLTRQAAEPVRVIDFDRVEAANLENQPYQRHQIGHPKTRALEELVMRANGRRIEPLQKRLTPDNAARLLDGADLVIDMFDNHAARAAVHQTCAGRPCIHAGTHPSGYAEVIWNERYVVPPDVEGDACALRMARKLSLFVVAVCAHVIDGFRERGARDSFTITLRDLRVEPL